MSRYFELLTETVRSDREVAQPGALAQGLEDPLDGGKLPAGLADFQRAISDSLDTGPRQHKQAESGASVMERDGLRATDVKVVINKKARLTSQALDRAVMEHYRRLRTKVLQQKKIDGFQTLLITSPNPQEGKTVTVFNLGLSFAMLPSFKVLVVDGDLRRGSLRSLLGIGERPGLGNLLDGSARLEDVVLKCDEFPLHFVLAGSSPVSAGELLQSEELRKTFRKMTDEFSLVLVDAPPVNVLTDVQLLASACDGVLLVARAFHTRRKQLEKAVQELAAFHVIGSVLNGGPPMALYGGYKDYY